MVRTEIDAATLGHALGKRRTEVDVTSQRPEVTAGFDKAITALVELALSGGWTMKDADQFWAAYESQGDRPLGSLLWTMFLDYPLGIAR